MNEELKKELFDIIHNAPRKRVDRWLIISLILIGMLASAGAINWLSDKTSSNEAVLDAVNDVTVIVTNNTDQITRVEDKVNCIERKQALSDSETYRMNKLYIKNLNKNDQREAQILQEIYNQMKRDQSPKDRKESEDESYLEKIEPIKAELQVYVPEDITIKKKMTQ